MMTTEKSVPAVTEATIDSSSSNDNDGQNRQDGKTAATFSDRVSAFFGGWYYVWEVFGIALSGLAIVAICVVVYVFDDHEAPDWTAKVPGKAEPFRLTLNSLLSILSVFGSTCAMIPVTKGLGQLKYLWFMEEDRVLADLETFDSASRGKVGSAQLIWKLRFKHLAVLGGLASLLALAYGPFVQNLIVIEIEYRPTDNSALISYVSHYQANSMGNNTDVDRAMAYNIQRSIAETTTDWLVPVNDCRTGACEWSDYWTTGACSRCSDISHLVKRTCTPVVGEQGGCDLALPNGFAFSNLSSDPWGVDMNRMLMAVNTSFDPLVLNYSRPFVVVQSIMGLDPSQLRANASDTSRSDSETLRPYRIDENSVVSAQECAIVPCVQRQRFKLSRLADQLDPKHRLSSSGTVTPHLTTVDDQWDETFYMEDDEETLWIRFNASAVGMPEPQLAQYVGTFGDNKLSAISERSHAALSKFLNYLLTGWVYTESNEVLAPAIKRAVETANDFDPNANKITSVEAREMDWVDRADPAKAVQSIFVRSHLGMSNDNVCDRTLAAKGGIECAIRRMAVGITNGMRRERWETMFEDSLEQFSGVLREPKQICHAQWQYVSAPLAVWLLGLMLFIGVVWKTRRANIKAWRTSPLATLLLRLDPDTREHLKGWQKMGDNELRDVAEQLRLRLHVDDHGPRFVRRETA